MANGKTSERVLSSVDVQVPGVSHVEIEKPTDVLLENIASRLEAMGHPIRLKILHALEPGGLSVTEILEEVGGTQVNISKQLQVMRSVDLVDSRCEGMNVLAMPYVRSWEMPGSPETPESRRELL